MVPSLERQLARIVRRARRWYARSYLCAGDPRSAVLWSDQTEITVRLALRGDQLWILAGSGLLIRIVADSEGEIVPENVEPVLRAILAGQAVDKAQQVASDVAHKASEAASEAMNKPQA